MGVIETRRFPRPVHRGPSQPGRFADAAAEAWRGALAIDGTRVFFVAGPEQTVIAAVGRGGGVVESVGHAASNVSARAVDESFVYGGGEGSVWRVAKPAP